MRNSCRSCWWREGDRCYSTDEELGGGLSTDEKGWRVGREITEDHFRKCSLLGARKSKRKVLGEFIRSDRLIIMSESEEGGEDEWEDE